MNAVQVSRMEESATLKNVGKDAERSSTAELSGPKKNENASVAPSIPESTKPENEESPNGLLTISELENAIDILDEDLENAFGKAADSLWGFASSVGTAVRKRQPGLDALRKNVSDRLQPLDTLGRDLGNQIGALAPKEESIASLTGSITGSISSVAKTVQRNATAVEAAILAKANSGVSEISGLSGAESAEKDAADNTKAALPLLNEGVEGLAKVGETLSNSIVGQTVGGFWDGLWGGEEEEEDEDSVENEEHVETVPRTRFEQRLFELQSNPDTYCKPANDLEAFNKWGENFDLDSVAKQCVAILHKHEAIAELYVKVVPSLVEENTFWMRYFYAKQVLETEEERRRKLIEQAETAVGGDDGEDDGWGDDWPDAEDGEDSKLQKSGSSKDVETQETPKKSSDGAEKTEVQKSSEKAEGDPKQKNETTVVVTNSSGDNANGSKDSDEWSDDDWE